MTMIVLVVMMAVFYFYVFILEPIWDNILRPLGHWLYPPMYEKT